MINEVENFSKVKIIPASLHTIIFYISGSIFGKESLIKKALIASMKIEASSLVSLQDFCPQCHTLA